MRYYGASNWARLGCYIVDILIVSFITELIATPIFSSIGLDVALNEIYDKLIDINNTIDRLGDINEALDMLYELLRLTGINLLITLPIMLVVASLYLILLPKYYKGQTLGRALTKTRVVALDDSELSLKGFCLRELVGVVLLYKVIGGPCIIATIILAFVKNRTLADYVGGSKLVSLNDPRPEEPIINTFDSNNDNNEE